MYLGNFIFIFWCLVGHWRKEQDPKPDPLVKGTNPRIGMRIRIFSCRGSRTPLTDILFPWIRIRTPNLKNLLLTLLKIILIPLFIRQARVCLDIARRWYGAFWRLISCLQSSLTRSQPSCFSLPIQWLLPILVCWTLNFFYQLFLSLCFFSYDLKMLGMWSHMYWRE